MTHLTTQIKAHRDTCGAGLILLPVMLPGGPYSEDQESRIRSRFAIVSALGEQGYVPEDPEHIGSVMLQWPTSQGIKQLQVKEASELSSLKALYKKIVAKKPRYGWTYAMSGIVRKISIPTAQRLPSRGFTMSIRPRAVAE